MSLNPSVRLIEKESGEVLHTLPPLSSLPTTGDELAFSQNGGPEITYKVKSTRFVVHASHLTTTSGRDEWGAECHVEIKVSVA